MYQPDQQSHPLENDSVADLGRVLDHFPIQNHLIKHWLPLILGVLTILAVIALTVNLLNQMWTAIQLHGRAILLGIFPFPTAFYALLLVTGILMVVLAKAHWSDSITLFETGFVKYSRNRVRIWHYAATQSFDSHIKQVIFGGSIVSIRVNVILEDNTHKRWVIRNDYIRMDELIHLLRLNIVPGLVERAHQRLADGEMIKFHKGLQATQDEMNINGNLSPYDQIETVIHNQVIKLHQKGNPEVLLFKSKISHVTNLDFLLDLLKIPPNPTY
jgi:hypothetical protein